MGTGNPLLNSDSRKALPENGTGIPVFMMHLALLWLKEQIQL